jgi:hypothetical protein
MSKLTVFAIGAGLLLISAAAAAEMYRWVDSEGKVHYSDRPTPGSAEVQVRVPGDSPAPAVAGDGGAPAEAVEPLPEEDATQVRNKLCDKARERLANYEKADSLYEGDATGARRALSVDEQVQAIVKARREVAAACVQPSGETS